MFKRKNIIVLMLVLLTVLAGFIYTNISSKAASNNPEVTVDQQKEYDENVAEFIVTTPKELEAKISDSKQNFFVYFGRSTCPYCREFVSELGPLAIDNGITIYYLDTENTQTDSEIKNLRDNLEIATVPSLLHFVSGEYSKYNNDDLELFLTQ
ncbi:conjugal transfer protein TraF [Enterococcus sp. AZ046]|uniref:conjugal transfer protein TraF n=1 Tax=Enterococcus sp. AZ046 TaxID=2774685 RepID=UPI003D2C9EE7